MGKVELFKGVLSGIMTSSLLYAISQAGGRYQFSFKLDKKIEGIPDEFLVYAYTHGGQIIVRPGDRIIIEGKLIKKTIGKEELEIIEMYANHIYNSTLKCGF
ncbi:MAG: hypothetical protein HWN67_09715 [Candidatus Helarchaeota archaeon]|nr:hypothetical protein [Candidatus Helarchaeota archaeon]